MKNFIGIITLSLVISSTLFAQKNTEDNQLDILLIQGNYNDVVLKCSEIIITDSLNPEIYYKLGLAYQNLMLPEKSFTAYNRAVGLSPDNNKYSFALGKFYYTTGKIKQAEPIFVKLCSTDSLNWVYAFFLTDMYMQKSTYKKVLPIYNRFYKQDTTNLIFLDKIGFCNLKMGNIDTAQVIFEKSLSKNSRNIPAIKNLSYIYFRKNLIDTALYQLNLGVKYDSTDMDLYSRRADILFSQNLQYRAGADYFRILGSGDSSKIVLKRLGIGLAYNNQHIEALNYLLAAYQKDSNDFEISSYIGQTYFNLKQYKKSITYYNKVLKLLSPINKQIDYTTILLADTYRDSCLYNEAIKIYNKSLANRYTARICMTIANLYDEKLKDYDKAISYYHLFLNNLDKNEFTLGPEYISNVRKRLDWLVENKDKKQKVKTNIKNQK
jgi:tetratricopeptide (TPR) repeat protein